jgi:hypothetical protein
MEAWSSPLHRTCEWFEVQQKLRTVLQIAGEELREPQNRNHRLDKANELQTENATSLILPV